MYQLHLMDTRSSLLGLCYEYLLKLAQKLIDLFILLQLADQWLFQK